MNVYQSVTGYEASIIEMDILVDNTFSGFSIAGGQKDPSQTEISDYSFSFSGYEGYIFDQSGRFVGGYQPNTSFKISVHSKSDETCSYFIDDVLIANNYTGVTGFDLIEFDKIGESSVSISHIS